MIVVMFLYLSDYIKVAHQILILALSDENV